MPAEKNIQYLGRLERVAAASIILYTVMVRYGMGMINTIIIPYF